MTSMIAQLYSEFGTLDALTRNFFVADLVDIILIAIFIYAGFVLFKQTRSLLVLIGIGILLCLYMLAQFFNLYLTSQVLRSFFGVFLVVLVVIFQEELRRFFEYLALFGTRQIRRKATAPSQPIILHAVATLARQSIGALIIIPGKESIERHLEGGTTLDGVISEALIESLFDPNTAGHDGAMIITTNRISLFGAHLPLSRNFHEIGKHGTRHSAALGIAERTDALAIVVSEEHGSIAVAYNGTLRHLHSVEELDIILTKFLKEKFPTVSFSWWESLIKHNSTEKLFAFALAVFLWFFIAYRAGSVSKEFLVPITYNNPTGLAYVENIEPKNVSITLESRGNAFEHLTLEDIDVRLDIRNLGTGTHSIALEENMINRPLSFGVIGIRPSAVEVTVSPINPADFAE